MVERGRIAAAFIILILIVGAVLVVDLIQRRNIETIASIEAPAGSIPILVDRQLAAWFVPGDLEKLEEVSFVDDEEEKTQQGWYLSDVLLLYLNEDQLTPDTDVLVSSSSREKSASFSWEAVQNPANMVMFDLSGRGTLKLVSKMEGLKIRDEWVQDVDQIEVQTP
jgi:hypothetical protein